MNPRGFDDISSDCVIESDRIDIESGGCVAGSHSSSRTWDARQHDDRLLEDRLPQGRLLEGQLFDVIDPMGQAAIPAWSIGAGLMGLGAALIVLGIAAAIGQSWLLDQFLSLEREVVYTQIFHLPFVAVAATTLVAIMFWYPNVTIRFLVAAIILTPGTTVFFGTYHLCRGHAISDYYSGIPAMLMSFFVGAVVPGLVAQMMTHWEMVHRNDERRARRRLGIPMLLEFTGVVAVVYAVFRQLDGGQISEANARFVSVGITFAIPALCACFLFLRRRSDQTYRVAWVIAFVVGAWIGSIVTVLYHVVDAFSWTSLEGKAGDIITVSLVGAVVTTLCVTFCVVWLRFCGWSCQR